MIYLYRLLYGLIKISTFTLYPILTSKTKNYVKLRSSQKVFDCKEENAIWFHASSGEIEYCKSVITYIRKNFPKEKIVISYSSPSAEKLLFNIQKEVDFIFPIPWDSPSSVHEIIHHLKPKALVFSRTDFWPELIHQADAQSIPLMAIAMFPNLNALSGFIYKWLLRPFVYISAVTEKSRQALQIVLNKEVALTSDTRFDQVFNRLETPTRIHFNSQNKKIIFASTWPEDETVLFPQIDLILKQNYQLIICPHEVARASDIKNQLSKYSPLLLSEVSESLEINVDFQVLIIDRIGLLADIYRFTDVAFVGGSFKKKIHSVMEPLCCSNVIFFGPYYKNNPEALDLIQKNLATDTNTSGEIKTFLNKTLNKNHETLKEQLKDFSQSQRGATIQIAQEILNRSKSIRKDI